MSSPSAGTSGLVTRSSPTSCTFSPRRVSFFHPSQSPSASLSSIEADRVLLAPPRPQVDHLVGRGDLLRVALEGAVAFLLLRRGLFQSSLVAGSRATKICVPSRTRLFGHIRAVSTRLPAFLRSARLPSSPTALSIGAARAAAPSEGVVISTHEHHLPWKSSKPQGWIANSGRRCCRPLNPVEHRNTGSTLPPSRRGIDTTAVRTRSPPLATAIDTPRIALAPSFPLLFVPGRSRRVRGRSPPVTRASTPSITGDDVDHVVDRLLDALPQVTLLVPVAGVRRPRARPSRARGDRRPADRAELSATSTSTVGLPRESSTWRAWTMTMSNMAGSEFEARGAP